MHICKSRGDVRRAKMLMSISAGRRWTGDTRHLSSYSLLIASVWDCSGDISIPSDDAESLAWSMKESLSSSTPRSGEVLEELELDALDMRCRRLERDMLQDVCGVSVTCAYTRSKVKPECGRSDGVDRGWGRRSAWWGRPRRWELVVVLGSECSVSDVGIPRRSSREQRMSRSTLARRWWYRGWVVCVVSELRIPPARQC